MALTLHHAIHHIRYLAEAHFLLAWLFVLVLTIMSGVWVSASRHSLYTVSQEEPAERDKGFAWRPDLANGLAAVVFFLFAALYIFLIFYKEHFSYYDNSQLTDFSLRGRMFPPPIWPSVGRFWPLGLQEFNLLAFFTKSPAGFHSFAVAQLVIVILALYAVLREFRLVYRALIVTAAMVVPSFVISFTGLIYPERDVVFWLSVMVLCLYGYSRTRASVYFIGCLAATQFALYYKETVVVFVVAYALTRVLWQGYLGRHAGLSWRQNAEENSLSLGMLLLSGIYAVLFSLTMFPFRNLSYIGEQRQALGSVLWTYLQADWLPWILLIVFAVRLHRFMVAGGEIDPLWEPLAFAALAYSFVLIALRLVSGYYMAPADLIAILYLARISIAWLSEATKRRVALVAAAFSCLVLHNIAYSAFRIVERKGMITTKAQLAGFLKNYISKTSPSPVELFFPYASGYHLMELSAYLRYKGLPVVRQSVASNVAGHQVLIEGPQEFPQNRCVDYKDYVCTHADRPQDGALIVVLPDDVASMRDAENIGKDSALLFSANACEMCTKDHSWLRLLHAISPEFSNSRLPEHWLQLQVFAKEPLTSATTHQHLTKPALSGQNALLLRQR